MTQEQQIAWMFRQFPIGHRFWYMNVEFFVKEHQEASRYFISAVICDYVDGNGTFQEKVFTYPILSTL
jgi:hypothetical protein